MLWFMSLVVQLERARERGDAERDNTIGGLLDIESFDKSKYQTFDILNFRYIVLVSDSFYPPHSSC